MSKWINERAWTVSMYICYILSFIILSVAGYNCTLRVVGDTTIFMKVILFVCVCLFVAMVVLVQKDAIRRRTTYLQDYLEQRLDSI